MAFSEAEVKLLWPQAAAELLGFSSALRARSMGITADQLLMALQLAEDAFSGRSRSRPSRGSINPSCAGCGSNLSEALLEQYDELSDCLRAYSVECPGCRARIDIFCETVFTTRLRESGEKEIE